MIKSLLAVASLSLLPVLSSASYATADHASPLHHTHQNLHRDTSNNAAIGCYSSSDGMSDQGTYTYQSSGYCGGLCTDQGKAVYAMTNGNDCWCGDMLPPTNSKTDDSQCSTTCQGFPSNICGGDGVWSVYLTNLKSLSQISNYGGGSSSSSSQGSSTSGSVSTSVQLAPGQTVVVTAPAKNDNSPSASAQSSGGGSNTAGIAAGIVVGVVAACIVTGGLFFWLRRRRRQAEQEELDKQNQISDFVKPPSTAYSQMSDTRLDPVLNKRNSVGSLADDQDYSRRILRVANPDR